MAGRDPAAARAEAFARLVGVLPEGAIRAGAAGRHLARLTPEEGVDLLAALVSSGAESWGTPAIAAVGQALRGTAPVIPYEWRTAAYAEARERSLPHVASLFLAPAPCRPFQEPRDKSDPVVSRLTLGHKKAFARLRRDPDLLARLAAEGDPAVVRELLRNPLVTETIAAGATPFSRNESISWYEAPSGILASQGNSARALWLDPPQWSSPSPSFSFSSSPSSPWSSSRPPSASRAAARAEAPSRCTTPSSTTVPAETRVHACGQ